MWQNQMNAQFRGTTWQRMHMAANKHLAANQLVLARASWFSIFISWFLTSAEQTASSGMCIVAKENRKIQKKK